MDFYSGNYFCTKSNWNNGFYDSNNLVSISPYPKKSGINDYGNEDFNKLLKKKKYFDKELFDRFEIDKKDPKQTEFNRLYATKETYYLKSEVKEWLIKNVKDQSTGEKGWCCGNEQYNSHGQEFNLFFHRRKDALKFIKTWSVFEKPTTTYSQNTYVKKKLNLETGKLEVENQ